MCALRLNVSRAAHRRLLPCHDLGQRSRSFGVRLTDRCSTLPIRWQVPSPNAGKQPTNFHLFY
jgi:hypothetical protein